MPKIIYNNIEFDSEEERLFYLYIQELKDTGWIKEFSFHTDEFILSESVKYNWLQETKNKKVTKESTLLHGHVYTADFRIFWEPKAHGVFYINIFDNINKTDKVPFLNHTNVDGTDIGTYCEIKPNFDKNNMQRLFTINQKWIFQEHHILVQKIIPIGDKSCLFAKTFVPQEAMLTNKTKKPKKYKFEVKSLNQFIRSVNDQV